MTSESQALLDVNPGLSTYELGHISLGKLFNFSEVQFFHLSNVQDELYLPGPSEMTRCTAVWVLAPPRH